MSDADDNKAQNWNVLEYGRIILAVLRDFQRNSSDESTPIYISHGRFTADAVKAMMAKTGKPRAGRCRPGKERRQQTNRLVPDLRPSRFHGDRKIA